MTRQDFIEQHRHKIGGMILDAATSGLKGEGLSLFMRNLLRTVDLELGKMYDVIHPAKVEKPAAAPATVPMRNGKTA